MKIAKISIGDKVTASADTTVFCRLLSWQKERLNFCPWGIRPNPDREKTSQPAPWVSLSQKTSEWELKKNKSCEIGRMPRSNLWLYQTVGG